MNHDITSLPVYPHLGTVADIFLEKRLLLVSAEPGAGKTTLIPWKLLQGNGYSKGKILLLQPRRIAARAAAERIAHLLGEPVGHTVGLRTRTETVAGPSARLEVVTEGVAVRIIQNDQALEGYGTLIFDEFHERNIMGDLALTLALDCKKNLRPELGFIFMSATIESTVLTPLFGDVPFVSVPGRTFPVEVEYHPPLKNEKTWEGASRLSRIILEKGHEDGGLLVFLPGYGEIIRARELLERQPITGCTIGILHGRLSPEEQRKAFIQAKGLRKIILATNVAETSITLPGIRAVVDCGLERRVRFSPRTGMDHWETGRISAASAEQRKGRAGRLGPGNCLRLWDANEKLEPRSIPEIMVADLAPLVLETSCWGAKNSGEFSWLTPPPVSHLRRAEALLRELGMLDDSGAVTRMGRAAAGMGLHPRLARMVILAREEGHGATASLVAALLEEGGGLSLASSDFRDRIEEWIAREKDSRRTTPDATVRRVREEALRIIRTSGGGTDLSAGTIKPELAGPLLLLAYPDRSARRSGVQGAMTRWTLGGGRAAFSSAAFSGSEYIVVAEIDGGETDGRVLLAAPIEKTEILKAFPSSLTERISITWKGWKPSAGMEIRVGGLVMETRKSELPEKDVIVREALSRLKSEGLQALPWNDVSRLFLARCRLAQKRNPFPGIPDFSDAALMDDAEQWLVPFGRWDGLPVWDEYSVLQGVRFRLGHGLIGKLDSWAPESVVLPSGSSRRIDYEGGEIPVIAARLQEFFGCADTPLVGGEPALLHLLSPAGRPVQVTRDLGGFWTRTYRDVRKELLGRYPRHYWPENPMEAEPTARAKPRKNK